MLDGRQLRSRCSEQRVRLHRRAGRRVPCLEISSSTTSFGRDMIDQTRDLVLKRYNTANGYAANADVIYGDTDSVMIKFNVADLKEAMRLGEEAATGVAPVSADRGQAGQAGVREGAGPVPAHQEAVRDGLWTKPEKHDYMDTNASRRCRRDNCLLVNPVIGVTRRMRSRNGWAKRWEVQMTEHHHTRACRVAIAGEPHGSIAAGGHERPDAGGGQVRQQSRARRAGERSMSSPNTAFTGGGDRIAYGIVKAAKNAKGFEKSEDPIDAGSARTTCPSTTSSFEPLPGIAISFRIFEDHAGRQVQR